MQNLIFFKTVAMSTKLHNVFALSLKQPQKAPFLLPLYVCMMLKNYGIFNSKFRRHVLPLVKYHLGQPTGVKWTYLDVLKDFSKGEVRFQKCEM